MTTKPTDVPPRYRVDLDGHDNWCANFEAITHRTREGAIAACHAHRAAVTAEAERVRGDAVLAALKARGWMRSLGAPQWALDEVEDLLRKAEAP